MVSLETDPYDCFLKTRASGRLYGMSRFYRSYKALLEYLSRRDMISLLDSHIPWTEYMKARIPKG